MGLSIDIAANTTAAQRGVKDLSKTLDGVADALDDVADDSAKGGDRVERSFRDMAKAAERVRDEARDTVRRVEDVGKAGRDSGDDVKRGMKDAEGGLKEFKDEANSTAREAAASFDGSAESIADAIQEVAANAFAGFGPAGAVAGLAAAAGIGLAVNGFDAANQASEESKQRAAEWAQAFIEAGAWVAGAATQAARMIDIATDPEQYDKAKENAKNWGVDVSTAMLAMSGNATALKVAQDQLADTDRRVNEELKGMGTQYQDIADDLDGFATRTFAGKQSMAELTREMDTGRAIAAQVSDGFKRIVADAGDAAVEIDDLGNKLVTLPDNTQVFIDAKTGEASQAFDRFKGDANGVIDHINGREVVIKASADLSGAQRQLDYFISDAERRSFIVQGNIGGAIAKGGLGGAMY